MATTIAAQDPQVFRKTLDLCIEKSRRNIRSLADEPKSWSFTVNNQYRLWNEGFFDIGNWTTSFHTGMALLAWRETKDPYFLEQVERLRPLYREKVFVRHMDTMHDLGFLYLLYSIALYKLTGLKEHREVALRAADVFAGRFIENGGYIRAWGRMDERGTPHDGLAIIDCMMNLPLLYWASEETGDPKYKRMAIAHANTTQKLFPRADDSICHAYRFDPATGTPLRQANYCGYSDESHWARGTAWAIYGFALSHKHTGDARYLDTAERLARKFIANLGPNSVPVWDFMLPANSDNAIPDSSAASIAVCGLQEILAARPGVPLYETAISQMLRGMCMEFVDTDPACPGVLAKAEIGDGVGRGKNTFTSWGDYYLMEALVRQLGRDVAFW